MDIFDRLLAIEDRLTDLEQKIQAERTIRTKMPEGKKTEYMPQVTEELVELSNLDKRVEDTRVERRRKTTNPQLRAAVDAVSRAVEVAKEAQLLVEDVQHLAKALMDSKSSD